MEIIQSIYCQVTAGHGSPFRVVGHTATLAKLVGVVGWLVGDFTYLLKI